MKTVHVRLLLCLLGLGCVVVVGCNNEKGNAPAASIGASGKVDDGEPLKIVEPEKDTPEWFIREATTLRGEAAPDSDDVDVLRKFHREKNEKIIQLLQQAVAKTHSDKAQERLFNVSVHMLIESRLYLAMLGGKADIEALYEDAAALWKRDSKSPAAAAGANALVNLAYANARNVTENDLEWLKEFSRQAQHYAANFPREQVRSVPMLYTAAKSCELNGLFDDANACYSVLQSRFPQNPYAYRAAANLRRLGLVGNTAQVAGPSLTGEAVNVDDYLGQFVLVTFFSSPVPQSAPYIEAVNECVAKLGKDGVVAVGVCLDDDIDAAKKFAKEKNITWPVIYFTEEDKKGWNNPISVYYGVTELPMVWLIDRDGNVAQTAMLKDDILDTTRASLKGQTLDKKPKTPASPSNESGSPKTPATKPAAAATVTAERETGTRTK